MSVIDLLMKMDAGKMTSVPEKSVKIPSLSRKTGADFEAIVQAVSGRRMTDLSAYMIGKNGEVDYGKAYDANLLIVVEGMKEPDLKNKELLDHFGAKTPKELAEILFNGGEVTDLANEIRTLSGYQSEGETEEAVKN